MIKKIIQLFHTVPTNVGDILWRDFPDSGKYKYYYLEDETYLICNIETNQLFVIKARSPREAFRRINGTAKNED